MNVIQLLTTKSGYDMQFLSGVSYSLPNTCGFFIADSACGDGKTTMITNITAQMSHSGVLIITQTTDAADKIFEDIGKTIPKSHICLLHSQAKAEKYMAEHRKEPESLRNYAVLIITAVRLQQYPVELFIKFGMLGNQYRAYVLIDELISFFPASAIDLKKLLPDISFIAKTRTSKKGKFVKEIKIKGKPFYQYLYNDSLLMEAGIKENPVHKEHFKSPLAEYRLHEVLRPVSVSGMLELPSLNMDTLSVNSTVILFDGTADVMFPKDKRLMSSGRPMSKYSSDITFKQFHLPFRRRNGSDWNLDNLDILGDDLFKKIASLTHIEKVLIITWKDIDRKVKGKSIDDLEVRETFDFPDILSKLLDDRGAVKSNYGIIYRGSGLERGCNEYKDFETIIFLGEWFIDDNISPKLNIMFSSNTTIKDYKKSLLIQSICRLRIRQHSALPIKVYFSDDMDYNLIYEVQEYFKTNSKVGCRIDGVLEPIPRLDKREKNHLFDISLLSTAYPQLADAYINHHSLSIDMPKSDLFRILPKDKKCVNRYSPFIKYLKSRGITLNIK